MANLDIRTVIFLTAFSGFAMGVALFVTARSYPSRIKGMNLWAIASAGQGLGLTLLWLRDRIPDGISIVGGNTLVILSVVLSYRAVMEFKSKRFPMALPYSLVAGCRFYFHDIHSSRCAQHDCARGRHFGQHRGSTVARGPCVVAGQFAP